MANKFCRFLGNQYRLDLAGIAPCCYYRKRIDFFDTEQFQELHNTVTNQDSWTPECEFCKEKEDTGQDSPRQKSLINYIHYGLNGDIDPDELTALEIQTDTDCNGACLICSPTYSTTWQKFESKFNPSIKIFEDNKQGIDKRLARAKEIFDFSKLKKIGFVNGGEPLKSKTHLQFLNELEQSGVLENVTIAYVTNGSIKPCDETVRLWKKAKNIKLSISVDGIGEHFNYLRWPLNFNQIQENISYILNLNLPGYLGFSYAVTPLSIFYHDRCEKWFHEFFKDYNGKMSVLNSFVNPFGTDGIINMRCVPARLRFEILKKYGPDHPISKLIDFVNLNEYQKFIDYINLQDQRRGLNFRKVFPEIEHFFKN